MSDYKMVQNNRHIYCWRGRLPSTLIALLSALVAVGAAAASVEAPATRPSPQVTRWLAELGHGDSTVREAARYELMGLERGDLEQLRSAIIASADLQPSQLAVLRDIVLHVFLSGEKYPGQEQGAFMGIRFDPAPPQPGVVIFERFPGFDAYRQLRDGDVIVQFGDDQRVMSNMVEFTQTIRGLPPGEVVRFHVLRQGRAVPVAVRLHPRPQAADDEMKIRQLENERRLLAERYWQEHFAPLLQDGAL